jgi:hypothetical protein
VRDGQVRRKNCWRGAPDYARTHQVRIERFRPRPRFRHFVSPADITAFLGLLPDWRELAIGLERVVLSADTDCLGWHRPGTIALCAWEAHGSVVLFPRFHAEHADVLHRLKVPCRPIVMVRADADRGAETPSSDCVACGKPIAEDKSWYRLLGERDVLCDDCGYCAIDLPAGSRPEEDEAPGYLAEFTESTIQAFQLLHVLLHELGHHHDRMTSPRQRDATRGETYAEEYARRYENKIWSAYQRAFRFH